MSADGGDWEGARTVALAVAGSSPLRRQALFAAASAEINLKRYDDAFGRLQGLASQAPSPEVFNNLGVIQLRRPPTPQTGRATYYFNKAVELEPSADVTFNLGYAYWREQDNAAALYWLRESVRRDPADADAHFVLAASLDSTGAAGSRRRARAGPAPLGGIRRRRTAPQGTTVPPNLERVSAFLRRPESGRTDSALVATEQREQREMATFHLDRGRRFYEREDDRSALTELQRVIYLSPYQSEAHLLVGRIYLRAGRTREAIEALKISLWSEETAAAHQALAEAYVQAKDTGSARKEAERAAALTRAHRRDEAAPAAGLTAQGPIGCYTVGRALRPRGSENYERRRVPRDTTERQAAHLPVHGGDRRVVVIFLCGVMVGRGVRSGRGETSRAPSSRHPRRHAGACSRARASIERGTKGQATAHAADADEDTSAYKDLTADKPKDTALATPAKGQAKPAVTAPAPAPPKAPRPRRPRWREKARRSLSRPLPWTRTSLRLTSGGYAVQLTALRDRSEADAVVKRLAGKGYPVRRKPAAGKPPVYRVQVGRYQNRADADRIASKLQKEEQFSPWVTH